MKKLFLILMSVFVVSVKPIREELVAWARERGAQPGDLISYDLFRNRHGCYIEARLVNLIIGCFRYDEERGRYLLGTPDLRGLVPALSKVIIIDNDDYDGPDRS